MLKNEMEDSDTSAVNASSGVENHEEQTLVNELEQKLGKLGDESGEQFFETKDRLDESLLSDVADRSDAVMRKHSDGMKVERSSDLENSEEESASDNKKPQTRIDDDSKSLNKSDACSKYEADLASMQETEQNLKEQLAAAQHLAERYQNELSGERIYRKELEAKTSTLCADSEREVRLAVQGSEECERQITAAEKRCEKMVQEQSDIISRLKDRISSMQQELIKVSDKYLKLLGSNRKCSAEMQAQTIELPQDVDQLQFLCLQLREEIIETRAAKEHSETVLRDEVTMLQEQRREDQIEKFRIEKEFSDQLNSISEELGVARSQLTSMHDAYSKVDELERRIVDYQKVIEDSEKQVKTMQKERIDLEMAVALGKQRCSALQQELDTTETVQKDFVKLSQSLQIELEKIRQAEQEVRWQFDEDVHACNQCLSNFAKNRMKLHCSHCGKIFCSICLNATVPSGPQRRPARVCQVCHTLLSRDAAPFFSQNDLDSSN